MLLDIIMVVVILTLFDKSFIGMGYHEIAGLTLIGIMAIHNVFNNRGNAKVLFITKDGLQSFLMFFDMIFSVAVITYWIVYEKKRRIHRPLLVGNTISEELKRISTQEQK